MVLVLKPLIRPSPKYSAAAAPGDDLVSQAQARLAANKSSSLVAQRLKRQYGLPNEAELGLRLLTPPQLKQFITAGEKDLKGQLAEDPSRDRGEIVLEIISGLDPNVVRMVKKLMDLDSAGAPPKASAGPRPPKALAGPRPPATPPPKVEGPRPPATPPPKVAGAQPPATPPPKGSIVGTMNKAGVMKAAQARVTRSKQQFAAMSKLRTWKVEFGLDDQTELSIKMLEPAHLAELFSPGGEAAVRERIGGADETPDEVLQRLVSQLDPEVKSLVAQLMQLDGLASSASAPASAPAAKVATQLPAPGSLLWRPLLKQVYTHYNPSQLGNLDTIIAKYQRDEETLYDALVKKYGFTKGEFLRPTQAKAKVPTPAKPGMRVGMLAKTQLKTIGNPPPKVVAAKGVTSARLGTVQQAGSVGADLVEVAKKRLLAQKTSANAAAVQKLSSGINFSDEVLLGLRLLPSAKLLELAGRHVSLRQQLAQAADKNQCMMSMIWAIDPEVQTMVHRLMELDSASTAASASSAGFGSSAAGQFRGRVAAGYGPSPASLYSNRVSPIVPLGTPRLGAPRPLGSVGNAMAMRARAAHTGYVGTPPFANTGIHLQPMRR